jgi:hypothetical protein
MGPDGIFGYNNLIIYIKNIIITVMVISTTYFMANLQNRWFADRSTLREKEKS